MRLGQTFSYLLQIAQQLSQFSVFAMDLFPQRYPIDKLHRNEMNAVALADFMNGSDIRMIERRGRLCFLLEAAHSLSVGSKISREDIQSNFTLQPCVLGE